MNRSVVAAFFLAVCLLLMARPNVAQERMSDKDIENIMKNLKQDSQKFQSSFNSAVGKSTIRKTSEEKDDKTLVKNFRSQVENMLQVFQDSKKADSTLPGVLGTARQIEDVLAKIHLGGATSSDWSRCRSELAILQKAFHMD